MPTSELPSADKTDCPFTLDAGHFQIEMDFADFTYNLSNGEHGKSITYRMAPLNAKIGLLNNVDLQLVLVPWLLERTWLADGTIADRSGMDGITPRLKINLIGNDSGFFAIALIPFLTIPIGLGAAGAIEWGLGIPYAFDIPGWDAGAQTTMYSNREDATSPYQLELSNSVSIGHKIFSSISYSGELFNSFTLNHAASPIWTADTWFTYQSDENWRIDAGVYIGLSSAADSWQPWVGMTWRD